MYNVEFRKHQDEAILWFAENYFQKGNLKDCIRCVQLKGMLVVEKFPPEKVKSWASAYVTVTSDEQTEVQEYMLSFFDVLSGKRDVKLFVDEVWRAGIIRAAQEKMKNAGT